MIKIKFANLLLKEKPLKKIFTWEMNINIIGTLTFRTC